MEHKKILKFLICSFLIVILNSHLAKAQEDVITENADSISNSNQAKVQESSSNEDNSELENKENKDVKEEKGPHGVNEPTWDNPPDWFPNGDEDLPENPRVVKEGNDDNIEITDSKENKEKTDEKEETKEEEDMYEGLGKEAWEKKVKEEEEEFSKKIVEEMGINKMTEVTKDTFREYMTRIIFSNIGQENPDEEVEEDPEEEEFLNLLLEEIMQQIPDKFPIEEFSTYSDTDRYKGVVDKILKAKFGENYGDEMMKMMSGAFDSEKEGMPNLEDLDSMMKEFNQAQGKDGEQNDGTDSEEEVIPDELKNLTEEEKLQKQMDLIKQLEEFNRKKEAGEFGDFGADMKNLSPEEYDKKMRKNLGLGEPTEKELQALKEMNKDDETDDLDVKKGNDDL